MLQAALMLIICERRRRLLAIVGIIKTGCYYHALDDVLALMDLLFALQNKAILNKINFRYFSSIKESSFFPADIVHLISICLARMIS